MKKNIILIGILCFTMFTGCAVFKSERQSIIPKQVTLDSRQVETVQEDAKVLSDIAEYIKINGIKPGDERAILLADGTKILVKYFGEPYEDVNGLDLKVAKRANERAKNVVDDYAQERSEFSDKLDEAREKQITQVNSYWDWRKLLFGGVFGYILLAVGGTVLLGFFPYLAPFFSLAFQGLKIGFKGVGIIAKFGFTGIVNVFKAIESWREANKGTPAGQSFDNHMQATLHTDDKVSLDALKNHFDI